jgi:1-aminocyclopropane-1-carboxylate deaminase/D-cysteine desulfhydrase-like pyridoxal-dependent ACC family enzyme
LVTASHRSSPQGKLVAYVAKALGVPCRVYTAAGKLSPELMAAQAAGAIVVQHSTGHKSVITRRALDDPESPGWRLIPFGMEGEQSVQQMAAQAHATVAQMQNQGATARRVVVPVGSGMSLAGILHGFARAGFTVPVLGVQVRADPYQAPEQVGARGLARAVPVGPERNRRP